MAYSTAYQREGGFRSLDTNQARKEMDSGKKCKDESHALPDWNEDLVRNHLNHISRDSDASPLQPTGKEESHFGGVYYVQGWMR